MESREDIEQAAALWIARRDAEGWNAQDATALQSWLAQSTARRAAYYRLNSAWQEVGRLRILKDGAASPVRPTADAGESHGPTDTCSEPHAARWFVATRRSFRPAVAIAATLLIHLGAVAALWLHRQVHPERYMTALGEIQSIPMSDGSRVTLNTDSSLQIALKHGLRRVDLERGEAFFEVAKDPKRPFMVAVGDRIIVAVGTQFSVRREGDDLKVTVSEGTVRMDLSKRETENGQQRSAVISPENALWRAGTVARVRGDNVLLQKEAMTEIDAGLSWRVGLLQFHDTPLSSVIAEFNRYNEVKILVQDPATAAIPISGIFRTTQVAPFVHLLEQQYLVHATLEDDRVLLKRPEPAR